MKQIAPDTNGVDYKVYGRGGSWIRLDDDLMIEWQRQFFDFGHVVKLYT